MELERDWKGKTRHLQQETRDKIELCGIKATVYTNEMEPIIAIKNQTLMTTRVWIPSIHIKTTCTPGVPEAEGWNSWRKLRLPELVISALNASMYRWRAVKENTQYQCDAHTPMYSHTCEHTNTYTHTHKRKGTNNPKVIFFSQLNFFKGLYHLKSSYLWMGYLVFLLFCSPCEIHVDECCPVNELIEPFTRFNVHLLNKEIFCWK